MPDRVLPAQNPTAQKAEFGFSRPALPPWGFDPTLDRALSIVKGPTDSQKDDLSPYQIRDLDAWTGLRHYQYDMPGGVPVNANIWTLSADGTWFWLDDNGERAEAPAWAPAVPGVVEHIVLEFAPDPPVPETPPVPAVGTWMGGKYFACTDPNEPTPDGGLLVYRGRMYQKHIAATPFGEARWWELVD